MGTWGIYWDVGVDAGMDTQARCEWDGMLCQMWDEMEIGIVIITNLAYLRK